jgi:2-keto-4-pentenoate hydratase/2-oxohepta-3-ene-1,7-dioic acid hydratase in catechol pathway
VTFRIGTGAQAPGALIEGGTKVAALPGYSSVLEIVEGGQNALDRAYEALRSSPTVLAVGNVTLLAPIPHPPQMRDFLCFEKHLVQAFNAVGRISGKPGSVPQVWYERPLFYHPSRFSVCGPDAEVPWPAYCEKLDFELEFGCYVGTPGKDIPKERAREHIFGYTIFNDFSARDEQAKEMAGQLGPGKGKDFDNANAMGPCLVTADELTDPYRLEMVVRVNGEEWGRGNSRDMHWKFEDCIAHASRSETLHPGEFFGSGTVGNGCGLESLRFLKPGDTVELEVEGIGILRNRVLK